jgi:glutamate-ammonia-ligase adenylyltransferase
VALGKFGGRELSYGADLDVVFVGENARGGQNLIAATAQASAEGTIASLDARLRPDGEKGPLVAPLAAYESYYRDRAQLWEIHALTRARPISGPLQEAYIEIVQQIWRSVGQQPDLFGKIDNMLERIQKERGSGNDFLDFKTGVGGMIEAEFLVQALQMRFAVWKPNYEGALSSLKEGKIVTDVDAKLARESYTFLRKTESGLRRFENKNVSTLPTAEDELARLAKWLGYADLARFVKDYDSARKATHALYESYVKSKIA